MEKKFCWLIKIYGHGIGRIEAGKKLKFKDKHFDI